MQLEVAKVLIMLKIEKLVINRSLCHELEKHIRLDDYNEIARCYDQLSLVKGRLDDKMKKN